MDTSTGGWEGTHVNYCNSNLTMAPAWGPHHRFLFGFRATLLLGLSHWGPLVVWEAAIQPARWEDSNLRIHSRPPVRADETDL